MYRTALPPVKRGRSRKSAATTSAISGWGRVALRRRLGADPSVPLLYIVRMKRISRAALLSLVIGVGALATPAETGISPVGVWKTFDDRTGKEKALVRIYEQNGRLFGKIIQSYRSGAETRVCVPCTDERKDQPIIGLVIIRNMKREGDEYGGGDILDPESGSVYHSTMHLEQDGARLVVRGYIGLPLLGRSQTWERQP